MCQEVHLSDVRFALLDFCEEADDDEHVQPDDLLANFGEWREDNLSHVLAHRRRERELDAVGDRDAAAIHHAQLANIARAAV